MTVNIVTYDNHTYTVSEKTAEAVNEAMAGGMQHVRLLDFGVTLALNDIRRMDANGDSLPAHMLGSRVKATGFQLPADYYSPEATAKRKAENKIKYAPKLGDVKINAEAKLISEQPKSPRR